MGMGWVVGRSLPAREVGWPTDCLIFRTETGLASGVEGFVNDNTGARKPIALASLLPGCLVP